MGERERIRKVRRIAVIEADIDGLFTTSQRQCQFTCIILFHSHNLEGRDCY